jgi:GTP cyclohydrolase I
LTWDLTISIVGSFASVYGIVLTVRQILEVKSQTESIGNAVKSNTESISKLLSVSDLSKHSQMICEVHSYISEGKWEIAHIRLLEVCAIVAAVKDNCRQFHVDEDLSNSILSKIKGDLRNLNIAVYNSGKIDATIIADHLDETATFLSSLCNKRKNI